MDAMMVSSGGVAMLVFLFVHIMVFRRVSTAAIMHWLVVCVLAVALIDLLVLWLMGSMFHIGWGMTMVAMGMSLLVYGSAVFLYTNIIFGLTLTSIRMQMLVTILQAGEAGISTDALLMQYNRDLIVKTRLSRLVSSGEVIRQGQQYQVADRLTAFRLYGLVHLFVCWVYGVKHAR